MLAEGRVPSLPAMSTNRISVRAARDSVIRNWQLENTHNTPPNVRKKSHKKQIHDDNTTAQNRVCTIHGDGAVLSVFIIYSHFRPEQIQHRVAESNRILAVLGCELSSNFLACNGRTEQPVSVREVRVQNNTRTTQQDKY